METLSQDNRFTKRKGRSIDSKEFKTSTGKSDPHPAAQPRVFLVVQGPLVLNTVVLFRRLQTHSHTYPDLGSPTPTHAGLALSQDCGVGVSLTLSHSEAGRPQPKQSPAEEGGWDKEMAQETSGWALGGFCTHPLGTDRRLWRAIVEAACSLPGT